MSFSSPEDSQAVETSLLMWTPTVKIKKEKAETQKLPAGGSTPARGACSLRNCTQCSSSQALDTGMLGIFSLPSDICGFSIYSSRPIVSFIIRLLGTAYVLQERQTCKLTVAYDHG